MIKPSMEDARGYCRDYQSIPISLELFSDIKTPIEVLKVLKGTGKKCYLLESVEGGEKWGRYSFLGFDPTLEVTCLDGELVVKNGKTKDILTDDPRTVLREILAQWKSPKLDFLPVFTGGFVEIGRASWRERVSVCV